MPNLSAPAPDPQAKKSMALWLKILLGTCAVVSAVVTVGAVMWGGFIIATILTLGSAGTQYNEIVGAEADRLKNTSAVDGCFRVSAAEVSHGNLDAIEKYRFDYVCSPLPANLDSQVAVKLQQTGYTKFGGRADKYRNACCELLYASSATGYSFNLYSNQAMGIDSK